MLETPDRFANKKKVWMYAGLGIMTRSSGGKVYSEKLSTDYNRLLKYTLKRSWRLPPPPRSMKILFAPPDVEGRLFLVL
jgi:hypothetical protein